MEMEVGKVGLFGPGHTHQTLDLGILFKSLTLIITLLID